jgi:hypothetical protein
MNLRIPAVMATAILACTSIASPLAAKAVVVRSAGPSAKSYPPGKALPDTAKIALQPGDSVTLVGPSSARSLRGPGTFPVASSSAEGLAMAANRRSRFGAMRSGELALNPSPWNVDVTQSGTICAASGPLKLWRPESEGASILTITPASGAAATIDWPAGKSTADWPASIKVAAGAEYKLALADRGTESVKFVTIPAVPKDPVEAAQVLVDHGCQNQLDVLVDGLKE